MKCFTIANELHIDVSSDEIEQMIRERLFMKSEPTPGVLISCSPAKVIIPLDNNDYEVAESINTDHAFIVDKKKPDTSDIPVIPVERLEECQKNASKLTEPKVCQTCHNRLNYKYCYFEGCKNLRNRP